MSFKQVMMRGAFWSLIEKGGQQGLSLLVFFLLARFLGPQEYGLANICFVFFTLTTMVTAGLVDGIVSLQIEDDLRLSSLFWAIMGVGAGVALLCLITANPLAVFMGEPKLKSLLLFFSPIPVLVALSAVPNLILLKEMKFKIYALRSLSATLLGGVVGIYMAYQGFGAYAIIGQQVACYAVTNLVIWSSISWRPRTRVSRAAFSEAVSPGVSVMVSNITAFLDGQAPRFMIGKLSGADSLGYFALSTRLRFSLVEILITSPLAVLYPALAKIKHDTHKQEKIATTFVYLSSLFCFPMLSVAVAAAPQYVPLFFGVKWSPAILVLQIYLASAIAVPFLIVIQQLFRVNNKMPIFIRANWCFISINLAVTLFLFHDNGLIWMSLGLAVSSIVSVVVYIVLLHRSTGIALGSQVADLWGPTTGAVLCFVATKLYHDLVVFSSNRWVELFSSVSIGLIIYSAFCFILQGSKIRTQLRDAGALMKFSPSI